MRLLLGITGASGSICGITLLKILKEKGVDVSLTATKPGIKVCSYETEVNLAQLAKELDVPYYDIDDLFAPPSSGTSNHNAVVILPCSMGTLGRIAQGISSNLLERAADVVLKERRKLILATRETPLNSIHIENMLKLSQAGAIITPLSIAFYTKPKTIDEIIHFQVGKVLDLLGIEHTLFSRWGSM